MIPDGLFRSSSSLTLPTKNLSIARTARPSRRQAPSASRGCVIRLSRKNMIYRIPFWLFPPVFCLYSFNFFIFIFREGRTAFFTMNILHMNIITNLCTTMMTKQKRRRKLALLIGCEQRVCVPHTGKSQLTLAATLAKFQIRKKRRSEHM